MAEKKPTLSERAARDPNAAGYAYGAERRPGTSYWRYNWCTFLALLVNILLVFLLDFLITSSMSRLTVYDALADTPYANASIVSAHENTDLLVVEQGQELHALVFSRNYFHRLELVHDQVLDPYAAEQQFTVTIWPFRNTITLDQELDIIQNRYNGSYADVFRNLRRGVNLIVGAALMVLEGTIYYRIRDRIQAKARKKLKNSLK